MERRKFLKTAGVFASTFYASRFPVIAGPFAPGESGGYQIPADKKLDPAWLSSLYQRGTPTTYLKSKHELAFIGMPVGGINTGMLYLGGDGRLWLWDIFNDNREGVLPQEIPWETDVQVGKKIRSRDGATYVAPLKDVRPIDQGFLFEITVGKKKVVKRMVAEDWDEISFEATYPIATVTYTDKKLPVAIKAKVYSPFIPLDEDQSGLPATIYSFQVQNYSSEKVEVRISGWLENKICAQLPSENIQRLNSKIEADGCKGVWLHAVTAKHSVTELSDYGDLAICCLSPEADWHAGVNPADVSTFSTGATAANDASTKGAVSHRLSLHPNETKNTHFVYAWYFPNLALKEIPDKGRYYASLFGSAQEVALYVVKHFDHLSTQTHLWKETFYDSTLPWWFLERTFLNISTLATTTSHRMANGRYYAWEGIGCCPGTCTHVWQYAQAGARIFPHMERDIRTRIDLGLSFQPDGSMWYRCEADKRPAVDGQAGTILRFYREHLMSSDDSFLLTHWPGIRKTVQYLMSLDKNGDGMEDTPVENTLDAMWDGEISWIVGLCIAAVKAGESMALEMSDKDFAEQCHRYVESGRRNMESHLFNGAYFIHQPDAEKGRSRLGSYNTCHIDQVYGQSWAHQVGLGRIIDQNKTVTALKSLWKYNFTPDVGPYIKDHPGGRPYALAGEGGLIMNTNPRNEEKPYGDNVTWQMGYFHECMSGFEHQVAAHMMAEGMVEESLVITRMIHDRYHAAKRNPFNEVECSDHYARAMASYGTFITACGFFYHGPKGVIRFAPKMQAEAFRAPFTAAEGWGKYEQKIADQNFTASLTVKYGKLRLTEIQLEWSNQVHAVFASLGNHSIACDFIQEGPHVTIRLYEELALVKDDILSIKLK